MVWSESGGGCGRWSAPSECRGTVGCTAPLDFLADVAGVPCVCERTHVVTVSADPSSVESRLSAGEMLCPSCLVGVLGGWGFARSRSIVGAAGRLRPRRARCRVCRVTHVLLPVVLLLRRAYLAELVWAALQARAGGAGHRRIGVGLSVPSWTVRGWLRRAAGRLEAARTVFLQHAVTAGVDVRIPASGGSGWADLVAAVAVAAGSLSVRFSSGLGSGAPSLALVASVASGGRLLSPGWPVATPAGAATPVDPDAASVGPGVSRG